MRQSRGSSAGATNSARVGEPALVVADREDLTYLLSLAAELEHGSMCEHIDAAFLQAVETAVGTPASADP